MYGRAIGLFALSILFLSIFSYALNEIPPMQGRQGQGFGEPQGFNNQQGGGDDFGGSFEDQFSFGLPQTSFADQQYVAEQALLSSMTSVYNWVSSNSTEFVAGCKGDRVALTAQIAGVIRQAGEASSVCARLAQDADSCAPDTYCPTLEAGKIPFPPGVKGQFEKAGINPSQLSLEQITPEMVEKVCKSQFESEIAKQKAQVEEKRQSVKAKLSEFRQKCEEFKKQRSEQESKMFDFRFPTFDVQRTYAPGTGPNGQGPQGYGPGAGPQGYGYGSGGCQGGGPQQPCGTGAHPVCDNGSWRCEQSQPPQGFGQQGCQGEAKPPNCGEGQYPACEAGGWQCRELAGYRQQQGGQQEKPFRDECSSPPPQCPGGARSDCSTGRWICESPPQDDGQRPPEQQPPAQIEQPPATAPEQPATAPEPPAESAPAQTAAENVLAKIFPMTGFVTLAFEESAAPQQPLPTVPQQGFNQQGELPGSAPIGQGFGYQVQMPQGFGPGTQPYYGGAGAQMPYPQGGPQGFGQQGQPPFDDGGRGIGYGPQQQGFGYGGQPPGGSGQQMPNQQGGPGNYGPAGQQGFGPDGGPQGGYGPGGPGPSPEQMCEMSDDEILDNFVPSPPFEVMEKMTGQCKEMASRIGGDIGNVRLRFARCKAEAAVMCAGKKEAAASCSSSVENPDKMASDAVSQLCRKFGVINAGKVATSKFEGVVSKFYRNDPALANQLGDTVESTAQDQGKLGVASKLLGDGEYAKKVKDRANKLDAVIARLEASGVNDAESIAALREQSAELKKESEMFSNFFDLGRLGRLFG